MHVHLLIKIAIVHRAPPVHTDGVATHEPGHGPGVKIVGQQGHILFEIASVTQIIRETGYGKVGEGIQGMEATISTRFSARNSAVPS
jgi:hypothetical protein